MSNNEVKIKEIERQSIMLEECSVGQFSAARFLFIIVSSIGVAALLFALTNPPAEAPDGRSILRSITIIVAGLSTLSLMLGGGIQNKSVPGFCVRILGEYDSRVYIVKTTPEQDQKEVCRVVQELEPRARAISKKDRELERIAQGCK
jgi:hypothetical protein